MTHSGQLLARRRDWAPALLLGAALALGAATGAAARPAPGPSLAPDLPLAPGQATPSPQTVTGRLVNGDGVCGANWRVERCGDGAVVAVRADMDISSFRGTLVRVQGLPLDCPATGRDVLWLTSIEPVADCAAPTPSPTPSPTPQPGPNLALNQPVLASGEDPGSPAELAVDGDPNTAWLASGDVAWIYVDLGQERTFNRLRLLWGGPYAVRYGIFVLEYGNWEFKYQVDGGDGGLDDLVIPRLYGRWVLLYAVTSSAPGGGFALNEWEIYGQETANLAVGQEAVVSDFQDCCPGHLANDGNYETGWASAIRPPLVPEGPTPVPGSRNPWLQLRLPAGSPVVEVRMFWDNVAFPWNYRLVFYDNQSTRALQLRSLRGGLHIMSWPLPVHADALLIYVDTLPVVGNVALAEVEVFGPAGDLLAQQILRPPSQQGVSWRWTAADMGTSPRPGPPRSGETQRRGLSDTSGADAPEAVPVEGLAAPIVPDWATGAVRVPRPNGSPAAGFERK